eukprot:jgi/Chlat1/3900/Chrsp26S04172
MGLSRTVLLLALLLACCTAAAAARSFSARALLASDNCDILAGSCPPTCTADETLQVQADGSSVCVAVDCGVKYAGARPVFDLATHLCIGSTPTQCTFCTPGPSSSPTALGPSSNTTGGGGSGGSVSCGVHGHAGDDGVSCVCDTGWSTTVNQDIMNYVYCGVQAGAPGGSPVTPEDPKLSAKSSGLASKIPLIAGVGGGLVVLLLVYMCYRRYKKLVARHSADPNAATKERRGTSTSDLPPALAERRISVADLNALIVQASAASTVSPHPASFTVNTNALYGVAETPSQQVDARNPFAVAMMHHYNRTRSTSMINYPSVPEVPMPTVRRASIAALPEALLLQQSRGRRRASAT